MAYSWIKGFSSGIVIKYGSMRYRQLLQGYEVVEQEGMSFLTTTKALQYNLLTNRLSSTSQTCRGHAKIFNQILFRVSQMSCTQPEPTCVLAKLLLADPQVPAVLHIVQLL